VKEVPGANTQGRTLTAARRNLYGAVALVIATNRELSFKCR
jgi:predicted RNase H-like HicB family nuclease